MRLIRFLFLVFISTAANAAPETVDAIQERIFKSNKSKSARTVKQSFDALQAKKFAQARKFAATLLSDPLYADYGLWLSAAANRNEAEQALKKKKYAEAKALAEKAGSASIKIAAQYPYSPFANAMERDAGLAELLAADALWGLKKRAQAIAQYEKGLQRLYSHGSLNRVRPETLGHYAELCSKNTKKDSNLCLPWLTRFASMYPKTSEEFKAMAKFDPGFGDRPKTAAATRLTQAYKAPDRDTAAFDESMKLYLEEDYDDAIDSFRKFIDEFPRSTHRHRARFWLAQALSQEQKHEEAQKQYADLQQEAPLGYYGLLSSINLGRPMDATIDGTIPDGEEIDASVQPLEAVRLKRAQAFVAEKAFELVSFELRDFKWRTTTADPFLMYLAALNFESRNYSTAFVVLTELIQRGFRGVYSSYGLRMIFPTPHWDLIQKYAMENQLDPILVLSLAKQESAFDAGAMSHVGAMGLMQLMPATASETMPSVARSDLVDPETNIKVGTKYLKKLLTKFNGNIVLALAGYNAGPHRASQWIKAAGEKRGMLEFIETIPYNETRNYVSTIIRNYYWYSRKLNGETPKSLQYFWNIYGPPEGPEAVEAALKRNRSTASQESKD